MIITRTPYRVSFFGGGTDYNGWFESNGGLVINSSFARYCYITIRDLPPFFDHKTRVVYSKTEHVNIHDEIQHPSIKNCLKLAEMTRGLEIHHDGDLPAWSGIGSSSSFTVGMLAALNAMKGIRSNPRQLAQDAIHVEQVLSGESVGIQDQIIASYGGMQVIRMEPGKEFSVSPLLLDQSYKKRLESHILLAFSGQTRISSLAARAQVDKIQKGLIKKEMAQLLELAHEGLAALQNHRSPEEIGKLMYESWKIKRSLTDQISNRALDDIYNCAMEAGAYGGRLLGAGGGGFFMFIAPPELHGKIREMLRDKIKVWVPFSFEDQGSKIIFHDKSINEN